MGLLFRKQSLRPVLKCIAGDTNFMNASIPVGKEESIVIQEKERYGSDQLGSLSLLTTVLLVLGVGILVLAFYLFQIQSPAPEFFIVSERGELIPEVPLDKPNMSTNALLNWVTENMMQDNTFNFVNYQSVFENARSDFTTEGFDSYIKALQDAKIIDTVLANKYIMRASPVAAPQITKEGVLANHYLWKIKLPMRFQYRNMTTGGFDDVELTLLVMRVPTSQSPYGVKFLMYNLVNKRLSPNA